MGPVIVTITGLIVVWIIIRRVQAASRRGYTGILLGHLALLVRENLPLAEGLRHAAHQERQRLADILLRLSDLLKGGATLSEALCHSYRKCPQDVIRLVSVAEASGQLSAALAELKRDADRRHDLADESSRSGVVYAAAMLPMIGLFTLTYMVVVLPKFRVIFEDFGVTNDALLTGMGWWAVALLLAVLIVLLWEGMLGWVLLGRGRSRRWWFQPAHWPLDMLAMCLPGCRGLAIAHGTHTWTSALRLGLAAGMPLERAAGLANGVDVNLLFRQRLQRFEQELLDGMPPVEAARRTHLPPVFCRCLEQVVRTGDHEPAMAYAQRYYASLLDRWWLGLIRLTWPVLTLVFGLIIGTFVFRVYWMIRALLLSVLDTV